MSSDSLNGGVGVLILAQRKRERLSVLAVEEARLVGMLSSDLERIERSLTGEEREKAEEGLVEPHHYSASPSYYSASCQGSN
jgi:hypothetical protein